MKRTMKYAGLALVSLFFAIGGQAHFTSTEFLVSIVPPYVPLPLWAVYVTGVLELIWAVAIWVPAWRSWAGIGLFALTVCVTLPRWRSHEVNRHDDSLPVRHGPR